MAAITIPSRRRFLSLLDDHEIPAFNLRHYTGENGIDQGIKGRIAGKVMCDVDLKTFVG